jgi:integrase
MLTNVRIDTAKPAERPYKLSDGRGLYVLVQPNGRKMWRMKYRFGPRKDGKQGSAEKLLALGSYPELPLKRAREKCDDARRQLSEGLDPMEHRRDVSKKDRAPDTLTFEAVARAWMSKHASTWEQAHVDRTRRRFERHLFPWIGAALIGDVARQDVRAALQRIVLTGSIETSYRVLQLCSAVFEDAIHEEFTDRNPCRGLRQVLPPISKRHHPTITDPKQVGELLLAMEGFSGTFVVACALRLAPHVFVRPGELRRAQWQEFDLDAKDPQWRIPSKRMKMREQHIVPLSKQALILLRDLKPLTGPEGYVFPSIRNANRPMSENTLNVALRRLGYDQETMSAHGFRSMASTILNEQQWNRDAIERQLAHGERDESRSSYNFAEHLPERRRMMQAWSDYLDTLREEVRTRSRIKK